MQAILSLKPENNFPGPLQHFKYENNITMFLTTIFCLLLFYLTFYFVRNKRVSQYKFSIYTYAFTIQSTDKENFIFLFFENLL